MNTKVYPRTNDFQTIYLNTVIKNPAIIVGDYTIYNDFINDPLDFEKNNVLYHYPINKDRLIIGKFCSVACGTKFLFNSANHTLRSLSNYTFPLFFGEWGLDKEDIASAWDNKGDIVIAMVCAVSLEAQNKSFYDFTVRTIDGKEFPLSSLKGKKVLVVNVASKCGLTPQYAKLQELYEKYKDKNFVIIGFPANNFMGQEPGSNEEIAKFCSLNYDVTFPMMSKISVKGKDMAPLYQWLTEKKLNGKEDAPVQWNFQKFMIDENGNWIGFVTPKESPFSEKILTWIEKK